MAKKKNAKKSSQKKSAKATKPKAKPAKDAKAKQGGDKPKQAAPAGDKKLSAIDAAAVVLKDTDRPMNCQELIEAMQSRKLWQSPGGKTPAATLYSAILREIQKKGKDARFKKTERGKFALNA